MTKTNNLTDQVCSVAMLVLGALPIAALSTAAHAATIKVSDLNLATAHGVAAYEARAEHAARSYCSTERRLAAVTACRQGVTAELAEKMTAARSAQSARNATFAAR